MRYLSDDGIVFDTELKCREHENQLRAQQLPFVLYDENLNEVSIDDTYRIYYIQVLGNPEAVDQYTATEYGWDGIDRIGIYELHDEGYWQNIDDLIEQATEKIKSLSSVKHQMECATLRKEKTDV